MKQCRWCEGELAQEEAEDPRRDESGEVICDECFGGEYEIECARCGNFHHRDQFGAIGNLFSVTDAGYGVPPGLYQVKQHPFYWSNMMSINIDDFAVELIAGPQDDSGQLCDECSNELLKVARPQAGE